MLHIIPPMGYSIPKILAQAARTLQANRNAAQQYKADEHKARRVVQKETRTIKHTSETMRYCLTYGSGWLLQNSAHSKALWV